MTQKKMNPTVESLTVTIKNFPRDLHTAAKISAAREKRPLKYWIMDACAQKLKNEKYKTG